MEHIELTAEQRTTLDKASKPGRPTKYGFAELEVGFGFHIPNDVKISSMRVLASLHGSNMGKKFVVSKKLNMVVRTK
jgi:hypothetical protein